MKTIVPYYLILDLDGVLITTPPWKADTLHEDGYSDFNPACVQHLNLLLERTNFELWLSSSRQKGKTIHEMNALFARRGIRQTIVGFVVEIHGKSRFESITAFMDDHPEGEFLILDDDTSLHALDRERKSCWVHTSSLTGFTYEKLLEAITLIR